MEGRFNNYLVMFIALVLSVMVHGSLAQSQTTHVVGDSLGWIIPPGGEIAYRTWAATKTFRVGDTLVFNFTTGRHDVAEVSKAAYDSCNSSSTIFISANGPTNITLNSDGEHHFICTFGIHCGSGQKLAINVSAAVSPVPEPQPATPSPPMEAAPSPSRVGMTYIVGDSLGWVIPPGGPIAYRTWARGKSFMVGDTLVFNFTNGEHDVVQVTRGEFDSCNITTTTAAPITTGPARITLTSAGEKFYICNVGQHCSFGQKLAINVTGGGATATPPSAGSAPPPSSTATPSPRGGPTPMTPSTPSNPSPVTPSPPSNSAPSFAVAALPFSFLAFAFAFLV